MAPVSVALIARCHTAIAPVATRVPMVRAVRPFTLCANISSRGRLRRSASNPPTGDSTSMGNDMKKDSRPSVKGEFVSSTTNQPCARNCTK